MYRDEIISKCLGLIREMCPTSKIITRDRGIVEIYVNGLDENEKSVLSKIEFSKELRCKDISKMISIRLNEKPTDEK